MYSNVLALAFFDKATELGKPIDFIVEDLLEKGIFLVSVTFVYCFLSVEVLERYGVLGFIYWLNLSDEEILLKLDEIDFYLFVSFLFLLGLG